MPGTSGGGGPGGSTASVIYYLMYVTQYGEAPKTATQRVFVSAANNTATYKLRETDLPSMEAEGYEFLGWGKSENDNDVYSIGDELTSDGSPTEITLYAKWAPIENGGGYKHG